MTLSDNPQICTLLFLSKDDQLLLALKKRGFGANLWNGVGGKVEAGETITAAAIRECQEEIGVTPEQFEQVAIQDFFFLDSTKPIQVHVFWCNKWQGEPVETEEMAPKWFSKDAIPYSQMWQDDSVWLPYVLAGKKLQCEFRFGDNDTLLSGNFQIVASLPKNE